MTWNLDRSVGRLALSDAADEADLMRRLAALVNTAAELQGALTRLHTLPEDGTFYEVSGGSAAAAVLPELAALIELAPSPPARPLRAMRAAYLDALAAIPEVVHMCRSREHPVGRCHFSPTGRTSTLCASVLVAAHEATADRVLA